MLTDNQIEKIAGVQGKALIVGVAGTGVALAGGLTGVDRIFQVFLVAQTYWFALAVGCLALVMLHNLCGGSWSFVIQRIAEAGARTLPFFFVVGGVIILGGAWFGNLYPWTDMTNSPPHDVVANKEAFLNLKTFTVAYVAYFAVWIGLSICYNGWSAKLDATGDVRIAKRMKFWAGPGLVLYVVSLTLAGTHWTMSLEPEWFSTIYGAWYIASYALTVIAFCAVVLSYLAKEGPLAELTTSKQYLHLGNFLLGFTVFWSYISFAQFLIIWNGNIPEEIGWYLHREGTGLNVLTIILMVFVWFAPMLWLMTRGNKTKGPLLRRVAYYILAGRMLDVYWNVAPSFPDHHSRINWVTAFFSAAALAGLGGIWLWVFLAQLRKRPIVPQRDPRQASYFLAESAHDEAHDALGSEAHG